MKTEKQKMLAGEVYNPGDEALITRWHLAKQLLQQYNTASTLDKNSLEAILEKLLGGRGKNVWIAAPFFCDYGENIYIGENTEINANCVFLDCNKITVGNNVLIAPAVQIYAVTHPIKAQDRLPQGITDEFPFCKCITAPVTIGDNTWIGGGSIILPGVTIGENTTIGAGSVVTQSIPSNVLAFGNPCRVVKIIDIKNTKKCNYT